MGRLGKLTAFFVIILLVLTLGKRADRSKLAVVFLFPNLAKQMEWNASELPITSEIEATVPSIFEMKTFISRY